MHSIDLFVNNKVIYKDDVDVLLDKFTVKKWLFTYRLRGVFRFKNVSHVDIKKMSVDFVLNRNGKVKEIKTFKCVEKGKPLYSNGGVTEDFTVVLGKNIFTQKELDQYSIDVYLYKDDKYKTLVYSIKIPTKNSLLF